ncbi:beta transducin [Sorochytrium milnesiophthora]
MVKAYLRYVHQNTIGVIASTSSNLVADHTGALAVAPANDDVLAWDVKQAHVARRWHDVDNKSEVTCIARSPIEGTFAAGYADGAVRIWTMQQTAPTVTFTGHKNAVTALQFDAQGARLASGGRDTDIVVWDVVGEQGIVRLKGHKDQVTSLHFVSTAYAATTSDPTHIISASKDTLIKVWDLTTAHCVETVVSHRSEVWSLAVTSLAATGVAQQQNDVAEPDAESTLTIVSGGADQELKVWKLHLPTLERLLEPSNEEEPNSTGTAATSLPERKRAVTLYGALPRQSNERVVGLHFHPHGRYFAAQAADKHVELYRIRTADELKKKLSRRKKRLREKGQEQTAEQEQDQEQPAITVADEINSFAIVHTLAKVRSFDFTPLPLGKHDDASFMVSLANNTIERYSVQLMSKVTAENAMPTKTNSIELPGHRGDIRAVTLSSDDEMLASVGGGMVKVWNTRTGSCIRSMECGYALCCLFVPGNRYLLVGTKAGDIEIFSLGSSTLIDSVKAHEGAVWSMDVRPDKRGLISGSADKDVKFWDFAMVKPKADDGDDDNEQQQSDRTQLAILHARTLRMSDEVLCVRYSPNQQLIAVSLLDATVKVFYSDSLKFFLSLYGHKLPVLSLDISSDNNLIITGSADKNVKIWGLDFGDCHRSLFAHQDSIMAVHFVWGTHYFFTVSKDKSIKYWDGDKFEQIMKLDGHQGEIWALAVAKNGNFIVTASHDRSIRFWDKTDEQLFVEEEREREMEEQADDTITQQIADENADAPEKPTLESLKAGERILEALDIAESERAQWQEFEKHKHTGVAAPPKHALLVAMGNLSVEEYLMDVVRKVKSTELDGALLVIPFSKIVTLLHFLDLWANKEWNAPLTCRVLFFVLKTHHDQIVSNRVLQQSLISLQRNVRKMLTKEKDVIGFNMAALQYLKREQQLQSSAAF